MAALRGSASLWAAASVSQNGASEIAYIGPGPYVTVWINSSVTATFDFEVGVLPTRATVSGVNAITEADDGGLSWHKYDGATALAVTGGVPKAFDLSPFAPQYLRLIRTDGGAASTVTALVTSDTGD